MKDSHRQPLARLWSNSARDNTVNQVARLPTALQAQVQAQALVRVVDEVWVEAADVVVAAAEDSVLAGARVRAGGIDSEC